MGILGSCLTFFKLALAVIAALFLTTSAVFLVTFNPFIPQGVHLLFVCFVYGIASFLLKYDWWTTLRAIIIGYVPCLPCLSCQHFPEDCLVQSRMKQ